VSCLLSRCVCVSQLFDSELAGKRHLLEHCQRLCADIVSRAHPDARSTLRYWQTTVNSRWAEVKNLADQKIKKMKDTLEMARAVSRELDSLADWLKHMETFLQTQNTQLVPENLPIVEQMLQTHAVRSVLLCRYQLLLVSCRRIESAIYYVLIAEFKSRKVE